MENLPSRPNESLGHEEEDGAGYHSAAKKPNRQKSIARPSSGIIDDEAFGKLVNPSKKRLAKNKSARAMKSSAKRSELSRAITAVFQDEEHLKAAIDRAVGQTRNPRKSTLR